MKNNDDDEKIVRMTVKRFKKEMMDIGECVTLDTRNMILNAINNYSLSHPKATTRQMLEVLTNYYTDEYLISALHTAKDSIEELIKPANEAYH